MGRTSLDVRDVDLQTTDRQTERPTARYQVSDNNSPKHDYNCLSRLSTDVINVGRSWWRT